MIGRFRRVRSVLEGESALGTVDISRLRTAYLNGTKPEDYQYQEMG
jgi:hypothetical protein